MKQNPIAFMSYVRQDDRHENGQLTQFRERLSGEVQIQTGEAFDIFQDRNDISWGQQWKQRINESLEMAIFLIPVITPAFFKSPACREELENFLQREKKLGRADLILPVHYVDGYEGIWIQESGEGTFEDNDLRDNEGGAWDIDPEAESAITRKGNLE